MASLRESGWEVRSLLSLHSRFVSAFGSVWIAFDLERPFSVRFPKPEEDLNYLITHFSEFQLATIGTFIMHESVFFLSGLVSIFFERAGLFSKYKIQKKLNTPEAEGRCILHLILYHVGVNFPVIMFSYPAFKYMGLKSSLPLPPWTAVVSQIIFYFILEDFVFYWGHRLLHTKWLYKHIHSVHHEYATPFGLTSEYAHPAEILFLGFATIIGPALTGPHLSTLWLWVILRVLETVRLIADTTSMEPFEFRATVWRPSSLCDVLHLTINFADFHDYHPGAVHEVWEFTHPLSSTWT
ncbi:Methylsterol monooxygenase 2-1, partial [Ananas comosus]